MKSSVNILIWDSPNKPVNIPEDECIIVYWQNYVPYNSASVVSVPELVESHADSLRLRYLSWVYDLGAFEVKGKRVVDHLCSRPGFSIWWMSLLSEKCNFNKSPQIYDALRLMAFDDWVSMQNVRRVMLVSSNEALADCIARSSCSQKWSGFEWQRCPGETPPLSFLRSIYSKLPNTLKALIWLIRYIHSNWALRGIGVLPWRQTQGHITFVSYLFNLTSAVSDDREFESPYWGNLPKLLFDEGHVANWLHIYVKDRLVPSARNAAQKLRSFNQGARGKQVHVALESFLSARIVIRTLRDWIRIGRSSRGLEESASQITINGLSIWPLFAGEWRDSINGITSINNLLNLNLFESALEQLPNQRSGVYLQENQSWEIALLWAWKSVGHGQIIGCPHSAIRFWDLRYFHDPRCYIGGLINPLPIPDKVAVNGPDSAQSLCNSGYPAENLEEVEALRYLYLKELLDLLGDEMLTIRQNLRLLVLGDYEAQNMRVQMSLLEQALVDLPVDITITVKPHPACPISVSDYPNLTLIVSMEPLRKLLPYFNIVFTGQVTASALDAFCAGLSVITMLDEDSLNLSPLRGRAAVQFISTPTELSHAIMRATTHSRDLEQGRGFFHLDSDLRRWRKLLLMPTSFKYRPNLIK
jgi:surface carbohydrate biosynthesis protein (TIGR04326 family)